MNIIINAILMGENPRGVGVYIENLIKELMEIDKENKYYVFYGKWMKGYDFYKLNSENFTFIEENIKQSKIIRNIYQMLIFPIKSKKYNPDIIHIPDTSPVLLQGKRTISTIHDLAEFYFPEKYGMINSIVRKNIVRLQIKKSKKIVTISNFSKQSICDRFGCKDNKLKVIYNGIDMKKVMENDVKTNNNYSILKKYNIQEKKYLLCVCELEKTKNVSIIIECFDKYLKNSEYKVVLCGKKGNDFENIIKKINDLNLHKKVIFTGYVTNDELKTLYKSCYAFIFPSLFEGFGLPVIEAMANKAPVICSKESSIPEVGGNAVITFNPRSDEDLYRAILYIKDEEKRKELINLGEQRVKYFSWRKTAESMKQLYEETVNGI